MDRKFFAAGQEYIKNLLKKYKGHPVNDELKKKIWNDLQMEKYHNGRITIPFKVTLRKDIYGKFPGYVEVIFRYQGINDGH